MKAIIVDDNEKKAFAEVLRQKVDSGSQVIVSAEDPRNIAQQIVDALKPPAQMGTDQNLFHIFINIEGKFGTSHRQDQKGVEILLWLRCKHRVQNPVILYGFQSNQQLLRKKPEHLIINSEGSYFMQLPYDLSSLKGKNLSGVSNLEGLKTFLRSAFNIEQFRHREANWWGVVQLVDVHRSCFPTELKFNDGANNAIPYPVKVQSELDTLSQMQAVFIYGHKGFDKVFEQAKIEDTEKELRMVNHELNRITGYLTPTNRRNPRPENVIDLINYYERLVRDHQNDTDWNANTKLEVEREIRKLFVRKQELEKKRQELIKRAEELQEFLVNLSSRTIKSSEVAAEISRLRYVDYGSPAPKILYIDDQANNGWGEVFQIILYGRVREDLFKVLPFDSIPAKKTIEDKLKELLSLLTAILNPSTEEKPFYPDIILLDVRLVPDYDKTQKGSIESMSGSLLLKEIRRISPSIPVMVTTASNKVWTFRELMRLGADAYWIKEGLDEQRSEVETAKNYVDFLRLIRKLMNDEYKFYREFGRQFDNLLNKNNHWWQEKQWINGTTTRADRIRVLKVLEDAVFMTRSYLQQHLMGYGFQSAPLENSNTEAFWITAIIQQLSNTVEIVHQLTRGNEEPLYRNHRDDRFAVYLLFIRHQASHSEYFAQFQWDDLVFYCRMLLLWLNNDRYCQNVANDSDRFIDGWSRDTDKSTFTGCQLTRLYLQIAWWLLKTNPSAKNPLNDDDKQLLLDPLRRIVQRHRTKFDGEWDQIRSRLISRNGSEVEIERELSELFQK